jgi:hypothetical protein
MKIKVWDNTLQVSILDDDGSELETPPYIRSIKVTIDAADIMTADITRYSSEDEINISQSELIVENYELESVELITKEPGLVSRIPTEDSKLNTAVDELLEVLDIGSGSVNDPTGYMLDPILSVKVIALQKARESSLKIGLN